MFDTLEDKMIQEGMKSKSKYIAMVIRNAMEDFHCKHLSDTQMKELNPLIRNAIYTALYIRNTCQACIFQEAVSFKRIPERVRLVFDIRNEVKEFIERFIKEEKGTLKKDDIQLFVNSAKDLTVTNMANAIQVIKDYLESPEAMPFDAFFDFLLNKVLLIYVSTENMDDAFRLFTILNDRGIPLRNSDILKSINLGALDNDLDKIKYAKMWEEAEGELKDDFDRFLAHIRTILVKEKARLSLLKEFEDKIYSPKEKDQTTGRIKPVLLQKGKPTFQLIEKYLEHYNQLLSGNNHELCNSFEFDNLIKIMIVGFQSTDWIPPLMHYYNKFQKQQLLAFLHALNKKFAGDWISQLSPSDRIEAMNNIMKVVEQSVDPKSILDSDVFKYDQEGFVRVIGGNVYSKRFGLYVLLMLDYFYQNHDQKMNFETPSVEHILPQNPAEESQWLCDFSKEERELWTNRLGNLVIITCRKNSSQSRKDYKNKKNKYFEKNIDTCPNSIRVLKKYDIWTPTELSENHGTVIDKLSNYYLT